MNVTVAKFDDRIAQDMPSDVASQQARIDALVSMHGAGGVFVDGVSVAELRKASADGVYRVSVPDAVDTVSTPTLRELLDRDITMLPGHQTDPGYVVSGMRAFYGDVFTDADEAAVRALVVPPKLPAASTPAQQHAADQIEQSAVGAVDGQPTTTADPVAGATETGDATANDAGDTHA